MGLADILSQDRMKKHGILRAHVKIGARIEKCVLTKSSFLQKKAFSTILVVKNI